MIRAATIDDMSALVALSRRALRDSWYRAIPPDEAKYRRLLILLMTSKQHLALVAEHDGQVVGLLLGVTDEIFFSRHKSATDILTYAERPGAGLALTNHFVAWAKRRGVYQIAMSESSGLGQAEPIYLRAGLHRAGGNYQWFRGIHDE